MSDRYSLVRVQCHYMCAGLILKGDVVTRAAPILNWCVGKRIATVVNWCKRKGIDIRCVESGGLTEVRG